MTYRSASDNKKISLLGYGAMRMPTVDGGHANGWSKDGYSENQIDQEHLNRQIKMLLDGGVNYFDTSPAYCRGESERRLGEALANSGYGRESYSIATKLSNFAPSQYSLKACKKLFAKSLESLRTDYIDNYLLHSIGNGGFETFSKRFLENGALEWCCELREAGKIRNLGFSFHGDPKTFEWCIENHGKYKWDFALIQMNYIDWLHAKELNDRNLNAKYLYDTLTANKIPVMIMEPILGGRLAKPHPALSGHLSPLDPDASLARWAFRFCGTFPNVITVMSGMTRDKDIAENIETFSPLKPCSKRELAALDRAAAAFLGLKLVVCSHCNYCMPCPYGMDIPELLAFRNEVVMAKSRLSDREILELYRKRIPDPMRRAEHCTGCGRCNPSCPQAIDIPTEIEALTVMMDQIKDRLL